MIYSPQLLQDVSGVKLGQSGVDMATVAEAVLGKSVEALSCSELLEKLSAISESPYVELKSYHKQEWGKIREELVKSIVSFMNGPGAGLLILGFDEKEKRATPIPPTALNLPDNVPKGSVEAKIRDTIIRDLKAVPPLPPYDFPVLKIRVFEAGECRLSEAGYIIVIDVAGKPYYLYYFDSTAYIREGSRVRALSLYEVINIVEYKACPILVVIATKPTPIPGGLRLSFILRNLGSAPANNVAALLKIPKNLGDIRTSGHVTIVQDSPDALLIQITMLAPLDIPVYPEVNTLTNAFIDIVNPHGITNIRIEASISSEKNKTNELLELAISGDKCEETLTFATFSYKTRSAIYWDTLKTPCP